MHCRKLNDDFYEPERILNQAAHTYMWTRELGTKLSAVRPYKLNAGRRGIYTAALVCHKRG